MSSVPLEIATTQSLIEELRRRCTAIVLLCQMRVTEHHTLEVAVWNRENLYLAAGLASDLQARILHNLDAVRAERSMGQSGDLARLQDAAIAGLPLDDDDDEEDDADGE